MTYNILVNDRKLVVKKLEDLTGKRARYTRIPRMAYIIEGIAVERNGTVTLEEDANIELVNALIAEHLIANPEAEEHQDAAETEVNNETEDTAEADEIAETEVTNEAEDAAETEVTVEVEEPSENEATNEPEFATETEDVTDSEETNETGNDSESEETADGEDATETNEAEDAPEAENTTDAEETDEVPEPDEVTAEPEVAVQEIEGPVYTEETMATSYDDLIEEEQEEPRAMQPVVSLPLSQHRAESIVNLVCTIYSRGKLLNKATGGEFLATEELVDMLTTRTFVTKEDVLQAISEKGGLQGLSFSEDKVIFDGYPATNDPTVVKAWVELSAAMNRNAIKQMHVRAKEVDDTNEKFAFRTWLTRLGMNGPELKVERNILYRNLSGHTAFRTSKDEEKWKAKQAAKRAELKARKAALEAESNEEEASENGAEE